MITRRCSKCHKTKPESEFYREKKGKFGIKANCKLCLREYKADPQIWLRDRRQERHYQRQTKRTALKLLGGCRCVLCESTKFDRLTVDHLYRDGVRLRSAGLHGKGHSFYLQILKMPPEQLIRLRVLCLICNTLTGRYTDAEVCKMHFARRKRMRWCVTCRMVKSPAEFNQSHTASIDGFRNECRDCTKRKYHQRSKAA